MLLTHGPIFQPVSIGGSATSETKEARVLSVATLHDQNRRLGPVMLTAPQFVQSYFYALVVFLYDN